MTNDHTSPVEESAGLTLSPLELMLLADAANLQAQPIGIQMADGICKALFSPRVSRRMPDYPVCDECNERHSLGLVIHSTHHLRRAVT